MYNLSMVGEALELGFELRWAFLDEAHHGLRQVVRQQGKAIRRLKNKNNYYRFCLLQADEGEHDGECVRIPESNVLQSLFVSMLIRVVENLLGTTNNNW
jgi:hypothetical protein